MLIVSSVFDSLKNESVMVTMNENDATAIREFCRFMSSPDFKYLKNDIVLYKFGDFDIHTLDFVPCEKQVLMYGADVETVEHTPTNLYCDVDQEKDGVEVEAVEG